MAGIKFVMVVAIMKNPMPLIKFIFLSLLLSCQLFAQQNLQDQIKQIITQSRSTQKLGKTILDLSSLKKLYDSRAYQALWIEGGKLNSRAYFFFEILKNPSEFGMEKSETWDSEIENTVSKLEQNKVSEATLVWYELFISDVAVKFAKQLYQGRNLDPDIVDDDTKFKRKSFDKYAVLNQVLSSATSAENLQTQLEQLEPKNWVYKKMKAVMRQVLAMEQKGTWKKIEVSKENRKLGVKSPQILDLKNQMLLYGFKFPSANASNIVSDEYDSELEEAISQYHILFKTGGKGLNEALIRSMNNSIDSRKSQVRIAMEKSRWLPEELELNHIFVNLAFQEFKLFEGSQVVLEMKTINGQKFRRTPLMRDMVSVIELNPTWTVPFSIAVKDKLPKIKKNPSYLSEHNMRLIDNATGEVLDATQMDWENIEKNDFNYTIVQGSGPDNALGLVKFPLTNPWSIYMHDTNERGLFSQAQRLLSSGCVRLEKPFEFANYLLKDRPEYSAEKVKEIVDEALASQSDDITPTRIKVSKKVPVYTLFLTVDQSPDGVMRFADDFYGSDLRLKGIIQAQNKPDIKMANIYSEEQMLSDKEGVVQFSGNVGEQQISKLVDLYKCQVNKKASCELVANLELNKSYKILAGDYLAVYENSMAPDFIHVEAGKTMKVPLLNVSIPEMLKSEVDLKLFKDVSHPIEQSKIFKEAFYFKTSPFKYTQLDNDFYLANARGKVINQRYDYSYCVSNYASLSEEAKALCDVYKSATKEEDLEDLFSFSNLSSSDKLNVGQYFQMWITKPGDRIKVLNKRILVSAPLIGSETALVFPGMYKLHAERINQIVSIKADN